MSNEKSLEELVAEARSTISSETGTEEFSRQISKVLIESVKRRLEEIGAVVSDEKPSKEQEDALSQLSDIVAAEVQAHGKITSFDAASPSSYPPIKAANDVAYVLGTWKGVDPSKIAMSDPVKRWHMDSAECAGMGYLLNLYYHQRGFKFSKGLIQPFETQPATVVGFFAAIVLKHNPYKA